jgi:hypothetical protein
MRHPLTLQTMPPQPALRLQGREAMRTVRSG